jgi:hypothetical protein
MVQVQIPGARGTVPQEKRLQVLYYRSKVLTIYHQSSSGTTTFHKHFLTRVL